MTWVRAGLGLVALLVVAGGLVLAFRRPSSARRWAEDQSVLPEAVFEGSRVTIRGVRNFRWTGASAFTPAWEDRSYDLDQVATLI